MTLPPDQVITVSLLFADQPAGERTASPKFRPAGAVRTTLVKGWVFSLAAVKVRKVGWRS